MDRSLAVRALVLTAVLAVLLVSALAAPRALAAQQLDARVITFTDVGEVEGYTNATLDANESATTRRLADVDGDGQVSAAEAAAFEAAVLRRVIEEPGESPERLDGAPPQAVHFKSVRILGLEGPVVNNETLPRSTHYALKFHPVANTTTHIFTRAVENETGAMWRLTVPPGYMITHVGGFRQIFLTGPDEATAQAGTSNVTLTFALKGAPTPPTAPAAPSTVAVPLASEVVPLPLRGAQLAGVALGIVAIAGAVGFVLLVARKRRRDQSAR